MQGGFGRLWDILDRKEYLRRTLFRNEKGDETPETDYEY